MKSFLRHNKEGLCRGITTGTCATAAAKAAAMLLLKEVEEVASVKVHTRGGEEVEVEIADYDISSTSVTCAVIKDAGDDPDITDGARIVVTVQKTEKEIVVEGGDGVGKVTRPGLKVAVGRAAINPGPMEMIQSEVQRVCENNCYNQGLLITVSAPEGVALAKHTMNERLGIIGGISILGTTGIVEPMSEKALIDTIKTEIDVHLSEGETHLLVTPGNYGKDFAQSVLKLNIEKAIKCSNYIGETLDYARIRGVKEMTLIGHAGKLVKVAAGIMNTHSKVADGRMEVLASHSGMKGLSASAMQELMECNTIESAVAILRAWNIFEPVWNSIGDKIIFHLNYRTKEQIKIRVIVFTEESGVLVDRETQ